MRIKSVLALLDVTGGRKALARYFREGPSRGKIPPPIPVVIEGLIEGAWSRDDGISQEFTVKVIKVRSEKP